MTERPLLIFAGMLLAALVLVFIVGTIASSHDAPPLKTYCSHGARVFETDHGIAVWWDTSCPPSP